MTKLFIAIALAILGVSLYSTACAEDDSCRPQLISPIPSATASATLTPEPSVVPQCGEDEHLNNDKTECLEWSKPESPEFFRNQGTPQPFVGFEGETEIRGPMK